MDATFSPVLPRLPTMQRVFEAVIEVSRALLMAVGFATLLAMATHFRHGGSLEQLHAVLPGTASIAESPESTEFAEAWPARLVIDAGDELSPQMRSALDYMSRRYRVSGDALEPIFATAEAAGRDLRLDPLLIVAVIAVESRFNPFSESVVGAQGLMQLMPVHQDKLPVGADELSFFDPVVNVRIGSRVLKDAVRRHGGVTAGLQHFGGAMDDPTLRYSNRVLAEKARLDAVVQRVRQPEV